MTNSMISFGMACMLLLGTSSIVAQEWVNELFPVKAHDFGTVPKGAKSEYRFEVYNPFEEDIILESVSSSCACSTPTIETKVLKTYEKGSVHVRFNTEKLSGHQKATLTVKIGGQFKGYATLQVRGYVRNDIVFEPASVRFDSVPLGEESEKIVKIVYRGSNRLWRIQKVESDNPNILVALDKTKPMRNSIETELHITLKKDAPAGPIADKIFIISSDSISNRIPLQVEGEVRACLSVKPDMLSLGPVEEGTNILRTFVVSGNQPFSIIGIKSNEQTIDVSVKEEMLKHEPATRFILPVNFIVKEIGERKSVRETIQLQTDHPQSPTLEVQVFAVLKPREATH